MSHTNDDLRSMGKTCNSRRERPWWRWATPLSLALAALFVNGACVDAGEPPLGAEEGELRFSDSRPRRCSADDECGRGQTCEKSGCATREGVCVAQSRACPDVWQPECGCDGKTYSNSCERIAAGVDLAHPGECGPRACGPTSARCDRGETCIYKTGVCGREDGICITPPTGCPRVWLPVCGCDGETYGNECQAHAAGVSVAYEGECASAGCVNNADCGREQYCAFPDGFCVEQTGIRPVGQCELRPRICPMVFDPVCGCDGQTYGNRCEAASAGVNVKHEGACEARCQDTADCPDPRRQTCKKASCDESGVCVARPEACPMIYRPVCGCDGQTYDNECVAAQNGVTVKSQGECRCDGRTGNTCGDGEFCDHDPGTCFIRDAEGVCVEVSEYCLAVYDPVCGCDGRTYSNDCDRIQHRVQKVHHGACEPSAELRCGGIMGVECREGQLCDLDAGSCQVSDAQGMCVAEPGACLDVWDPVCGCDGRTYSNDCYRLMAGASKDHDGECRPRECPPVCAIACQYGHVLDPNGCPTCACNPPPVDEHADR